MNFPSHLLLLVLLLPFANCHKPVLTSCKKFSNNQNLLSNAKTVVIILAKLTPINGFYHLSHGNGAEAVHGLSWCRAEISSIECSKCLSQAGKNILNNCHSSIAARSWFDDFCYLRYDTDDFVGKPDTYLVKVRRSKKKVVNIPERRWLFNVLVSTMLSTLKSVVPKQINKFAKAETSFDIEKSTIYSKAQCTNDISTEGCSLCLGVQMNVFQKYCMYRRSCEVVFGSCFMRYYTKKKSAVMIN